MTHPSERMERDDEHRLSEAEIKELILYAATSDIRDDPMVVDLMRSIHQLRTDLAAANERAERAEESSPHLYQCGDDINCGRRWEAPEENDGEECPFCENERLRTQLAEAVEAMRQADNTLLGITDELSRQPTECLGVAGDGFNQWPVRDEMIDDIKKRRKLIAETLSRLTRDAAASPKNPDDSGSTDADASGEGVGK